VLFLILWLNAFAENAEKPVGAKENTKSIDTTWMQVSETVVPVSANTTRNAAILGFIRKGQVLVVKNSEPNWIKVQANDTLIGWVPATSLIPSGPPVNWNPENVKLIIGSLIASALFLLLVLGWIFESRRKRESKTRAMQAMLDVKRRLQNKIQVLFKAEPKIGSNFSSDKLDLLEYLKSVGYVAQLEKDFEKFLVTAKAFKPNLILADAEYKIQLEKLMETDVLLINTPVVYMHCEQAEAPSEFVVRAYLGPNAVDQELVDAITSCLRKSPEKIRYSLKPVALIGDIGEGSLMELFHFLSAVKKSGQLKVTSGAAKGEALFSNGNLVRAAFRGLKDHIACEAMLDLNLGQFEFHERDASSNNKPTLSTDKILMDWARNKDESNHHSRP